MSKYLDTMNNKTADIRAVAYALNTLSKSFNTTGNTAMGEKLSYFAETLYDAYEEINKAVSKELTDRVQEFKKSAFNTVAACLTMTMLQK